MLRGIAIIGTPFGYFVLNPESGEMLGEFKTEQEAQKFVMDYIMKEVMQEEDKTEIAPFTIKL